MARRTKEEAEQTRLAILQAAMNVFWAQGVNRTSLADIASAAGVTRGAIYWHFSGKLDIFNAMCAELAPLFNQSYQRMLDDAAHNAAASLYAHCLESFPLITQRPAVARILGIIYLRCEYVDEMSSVQADSFSWIAEQHRKLEHVMRCAQQQGQLRPGVDAALAALSLQALRRGLVQLWLSAPQLMPLDSQPAALLQPFFNGVFVPGCWLAETHPQDGFPL